MTSRTDTTSTSKFSVLPAIGWLKSIFTVSSPTSFTTPIMRLPWASLMGTCEPTKRMSSASLPSTMKMFLGRSTTASAMNSP